MLCLAANRLLVLGSGIVFLYVAFILSLRTYFLTLRTTIMPYIIFPILIQHSTQHSTIPYLAFQPGGSSCHMTQVETLHRLLDLKDLSVVTLRDVLHDVKGDFLAERVSHLVGELLLLS